MVWTGRDDGRCIKEWGCCEVWEMQWVWRCRDVLRCMGDVEGCIVWERQTGLER